MCGCGSEHSNYISQLRSGTPEQRAQAASFLGAQRITKAIPQLLEALQDENVQVRTKVIWALGMLRSKAGLKKMLPFMQDPDRDIRQATARALMQIEEPGAIAMLESALKIEPDEWVVKDITAALEHLRQFEGEADIGASSVRGEFF
ncbi:MAG: HEAT repeat domain-containing protein [Candidatus Latescibacteria bacterium]|mgnify:CR=1 FL=1|nr:HEAT repeat domain-containing protein [Candidatus Latescibacterota bacterium]